jgi:hypothetical protein
MKRNSIQTTNKKLRHHRLSKLYGLVFINTITLTSASGEGIKYNLNFDFCYSMANSFNPQFLPSNFYLYLNVE